MSKKKNKVIHLTDQQYANYIMSLKDEPPTRALEVDKDKPE